MRVPSSAFVSPPDRLDKATVADLNMATRIAIIPIMILNINKPICMPVTIPPPRLDGAYVRTCGIR